MQRLRRCNSKSIWSPEVGVHAGRLGPGALHELETMAPPEPLYEDP
jgi:hypothetical protein